MRDEPLDFIGVDYALDDRESAKTILPLAADRGIAVLVYLPFGRRRLWEHRRRRAARTRGRTRGTVTVIAARPVLVQRPQRQLR